MSSVLDSLLGEEWSEQAHPRGWHGRWVGTFGGKVLRVFHGNAHVGDVPHSEHRTQLMIGVGRTAGEAGRTISPGDIAHVVDHAAGSPEPSARVVPKGGNANELRGGIPAVSVSDIRREQELRQGAPYRAGDKVHIVQQPTRVVRDGGVTLEGGGPLNGVVTRGAVTQPTVTSRSASELSTTIEVRWADGEVTAEHPSDVKPGHRGAPRQVRESALGGLLDARLGEAWNEGLHPRDPQGRFRKGDRVWFQHGMLGRLPGEVTNVTKGRVAIRYRLPGEANATTSMTHNQAAVKLEPQDGERWSAARTATDAQVRRLDSVMRDVNESAWQDRGYANALVSQALRDSGHAMGMTPGWQRKLRTNHASQLIKDLESLLRHGPGELAKPFQAQEAFAASAGVNPYRPAETPADSRRLATRDVANAKQSIADFNAKHPRGGGGKFASKGGSSKRARKASRHGNTVTTGAKGTLVQAIQRQLRAPITGTFDAATRQRVVDFQRQHGLLVDGIVGAQTLAALRGNANARRVAPGPIASRAARVANPRVRRAPVRFQGGALI